MKKELAVAGAYHPQMNLTSQTTLVVIDVQQGFDDPYWGQRNNPDAERNIARLLAEWRNHQRPVLHVQHLSTSPESPLHPSQGRIDFKPEAQPLEGEPIFQKHVNSALIGTDLEAHLRQQNIETLVMVGLTTNHCVSTSTRMAANLGFEVLLVEDATAAFDRTGPHGRHFTAEQMHQTALASLHQEFATVVDTLALLGAGTN